MGERHSARFRCGWKLSLACVGVCLGLVPFAGTPPTGASTTTTTSSQPTSGDGSASSSATLTLDQWKQQYEHDVGILADDVLVVTDDGKRDQVHVTKAKVKTTINDCRTWASDAKRAGTAAPPIPSTGAERAWSSMMGASARAASDCLAALQHGSRRSARDFQKQLQTVEHDEATLSAFLNVS